MIWIGSGLTAMASMMPSPFRSPTGVMDLADASLKLWGFSSAIGRLLNHHTAASLEAALEQQKSFWKFVGILTIALMALYALFFVGIIAAGIIGAATR